jgi:hypothetical protein
VTARRLHVVDGTYELFRAHFAPRPGRSAPDAAHLQDHVRAFGQRGQVPPPALEPRRRQVGRPRKVLDHERCLGKIPGQRHRIRDLVVVHLQVEHQAVAGQPREALPPLPVPHVVAAVGHPPPGLRVIVQRHPDATDIRLGAMSAQHLFEPGVGQIGVRDDAMGVAVPVGLLLEPRRLGDGVVREAERLDVDRLHHVPAARQRRIVGGEEIAPQGVVVADQVLERGDAVAQPGIVVGQVPEMHVGINDRSGIQGVSSGGRTSGLYPGPPRDVYRGADNTTATAAPGFLPHQPPFAAA